MPTFSPPDSIASRKHELKIDEVVRIILAIQLNFLHMKDLLEESFSNFIVHFLRTSLVKMRV